MHVCGGHACGAAFEDGKLTDTKQVGRDASVRAIMLAHGESGKVRRNGAKIMQFPQ